MNDLQNIQSKIYEIRGRRVMLDSDLAALYCVETKNLKRAVKANIERFPPDFMFELTKEEYDSLRCKIFTSNSRGGNRYLPFAFTREGIAMLSGIREQREKSSNYPPQLTNLNNPLTYRTTHTALLHATFRRVGRALVCLCLMAGAATLASCEKEPSAEIEAEDTRTPSDSTTTSSVSFNIGINDQWDGEEQFQF